MFLRRRDLIGLATYLRRMGLSVDRALNDDIGVLREFCDIAPTLGAVKSKLDALGMLTRTAPHDRFAIDASAASGPGRISGRLQWLTRGGVGIADDQVALIGGSLRDLSRKMASARVVQPETFVPTRYAMTMASEMLQRYVPWRRTRDRMNSVEHLHQNAILRTLAFEEIVPPESWLIA